MDSIFAIIEVLGAILEVFEVPIRGVRFTAEHVEGIGYIGASAWLIISLGRVQWENKDWRAVTSGFVLLGGSLGFLVWAGLSHYAAMYQA